jgi:hypothetical protein
MRRAAAPGILFAVLLAAIATGSAPAQYGGGAYQDAKLKFTEHRPGVSTGFRFRVDYVDPDDAGAQPPAVREVFLRFARGARFDTGARPSCSASDAELMAMGERACPPPTKLGEGVVTVDTGFPEPFRIVEADIDFLNNDHELIYVNTVRDSAVRTIVRGTVGRRTLRTEVGMLPGAPPQGGAIDTARTLIGARVRNYLTTPPSCPARGYWVNLMRFTYDGGVTQTVRSRSRCHATTSAR